MSGKCPECGREISTFLMKESGRVVKKMNRERAVVDTWFDIDFNPYVYFYCPKCKEEIADNMEEAFQMIE